MQEAPNSTSSAAAKISVLVADDEAIIRDKIKQMAELLGFEAHAAGDGAEALEMFEQVHPDLVVLDIYMPRANGLTVMKKIKETDPKCRVLLITGFMNYSQLIKSCAAKPDGFIAKPFTMEAVATALKRLAALN